MQCLVWCAMVDRGLYVYARIRVHVCAYTCLCARVNAVSGPKWFWINFGNNCGKKASFTHIGSARDVFGPRFEGVVRCYWGQTGTGRRVQASVFYIVSSRLQHADRVYN